MISATMVPMTKTILSTIKNALARVAFRIEDRKADRKYEREGKKGFNGDFAVVAFRPDGFPSGDLIEFPPQALPFLVEAIHFEWEGVTENRPFPAIAPSWFADAEVTAPDAVAAAKVDRLMTSIFLNDEGEETKRPTLDDTLVVSYVKGEDRMDTTQWVILQMPIKLVLERRGREERPARRRGRCRRLPRLVGGCAPRVPERHLLGAARGAARPVGPKAGSKAPNGARPTDLRRRLQFARPLNQYL